MNTIKPTRTQKKLLQEIDDASLKLTILLNEAYRRNIRIKLSSCNSFSGGKRISKDLIEKSVVVINGAAK